MRAAVTPPGENGGNGGAPQARPPFRRRRRRESWKLGARRRRAPQIFGAAGAEKKGGCEVFLMVLFGPIFGLLLADVDC